MKEKESELVCDCDLCKWENLLKNAGPSENRDKGKDHPRGNEDGLGSSNEPKNCTPSVSLGKERGQDMRSTSESTLSGFLPYGLETVGERLKNLREKKRLTQTDVAVELGISQSTYVRYEQNKIKRYKEDVFKKLAEILDTTSGYILGEENSDPRLAHLPDYLHSFVTNPESAPYIGEAYLLYIGDKVRSDITPATVTAEEEGEE